MGFQPTELLLDYYKRAFQSQEESLSLLFLKFASLRKEKDHFVIMKNYQ